ncbi:Wzz/FepE/Etk N-terminal domain-containing protein [Mycobacterium sp. pV006]|uniref:nucleotide-binding protein n=1 Tax=Mycobacterium sp. pV006 TaxID=3238983 RepID=UPI00351B8C09
MELLKRGWLVVRRRWPVLMITVVAAIVAVSLINATQREEYTASAEIFLRAPDVKSSASAYQGDLFSRQRAQTYVSMITSEEVATLVIDRLGLPEQPSELSKRVDAEIVQDTVLVTISLTDSDAQRAANIANAYGDVFGQYIARVENLENDPDVPPLVVVVKPATAENALRGGQPLWLLVTLATILALVLSGAFVWFLERFDTRVRSRKQIEEATGAPVVGTLPPARALESRSVLETYQDVTAFAESARRLSVNVDHVLGRMAGTGTVPSVAVSSVSGSEGRSVVAAALAAALADRGHRVALIDADRTGEPPLHRAALTSGESKLPGLKYFCIHEGEAGFSERALRNLIGSLAGECDLVVLDAPAFAETAEAQMVAEVADAALLVVRPGHTHLDALARLRASMDVLDTPVLGIVVNQAKETSTPETVYV